MDFQLAPLNSNDANEIAAISQMHRDLIHWGISRLGKTYLQEVVYSCLLRKGFVKIPQKVLFATENINSNHFKKQRIQKGDDL